MRVKEIAPLAELVSSVAVVATLIYLSIQTNQTNSALLANSREATMQADMTLIAALISNPEAGANLEKPLDELTGAESYQVGNVLAGLLRSREFAWLQYRNGTLDEATLASYMETPIRFIQDYEACRYWWEIFSATMDPDWRIYVNLFLEQPENTSSNQSNE